MTSNISQFLVWTSLAHLSDEEIPMDQRHQTKIGVFKHVVH